jgi:hypothetical protein
MQYVFVGHQGEIAGTAVFTAFGQAVELEEALATRCIADGFPLLPKPAFDALKGEDIPLAARVAFHELSQSLRTQSQRATPADEVKDAEL